MRYVIKCIPTDNSLKDLKYFERLNNKDNIIIRNKSNFNIPILIFECDNYNKIKTNIIQNFNKLEVFRINFSYIKLNANKKAYLLIEQSGFIKTIKRLIKQELDSNDISYNEILKWDYFYIEYLTFISNRSNIMLDNIKFPPYIKISSIDIFKYNNKKELLIDSIKLKNI